MEKTKRYDWTLPKDGVVIRAVLVEDVSYEASEGSGVEVADLWLLFISIIGGDYWLGYGAVDDISNQPQDSFQKNNVTELKKLSIIIGTRWPRIEQDFMESAARHKLLADDSQVVNDILMEMSFTELQERRELIEWEGVKRHWQQFPLSMSLN